MASVTRSLKDAQLKVTKALPAAGASNTSTGIDLGQTTINPANSRFEALLSVPATPSLASGETVTLTLMDSADNVTFAAIPELATFVVTGPTGGSGAATTRQVVLPGTARQYLAIRQAVSANAGNNTAVSCSLELVF